MMLRDRVHLMIVALDGEIVMQLEATAMEIVNEQPNRTDVRWQTLLIVLLVIV